MNSNDSRKITARFASVCPSCQTRIAEGETVLWAPGSKATHVVCPKVAPATIVMTDENLYEEIMNIREFHEDEPAYRTYDADDFSFDAWTKAQAQATVAPVARLSIEDAGVYVMPDGAIVKVKANQAKTRTYAMRWTEMRVNRLNGEDDTVHGEYVYEAGLVQQVAEQGRKMSLDEAKAFVLRYGQCARCNRHLKDAKSVEQGIGPVCIKYFAAGTTAASLMAAAA